MFFFGKKVILNMTVHVFELPDAEIDEKNHFCWGCLLLTKWSHFINLSGVDCVIMADVTYGACCVDDYSARALGMSFNDVIFNMCVDMKKWKKVQ